MKTYDRVVQQVRDEEIKYCSIFDSHPEFLYITLDQYQDLLSCQDIVWAKLDSVSRTVMQVDNIKIIVDPKLKTGPSFMDSKTLFKILKLLTKEQLAVLLVDQDSQVREVARMLLGRFDK